MKQGWWFFAWHFLITMNSSRLQHNHRCTTFNRFCLKLIRFANIHIDVWLLHLITTATLASSAEKFNRSIHFSAYTIYNRSNQSHHVSRSSIPIYIYTRINQNWRICCESHKKLPFLITHTHWLRQRTFFYVFDTTNMQTFMHRAILCRHKVIVSITLAWWLIDMHRCGRKYCVTVHFNYITKLSTILFNVPCGNILTGWLEFQSLWIISSYNF